MAKKAEVKLKTRADFVKILKKKRAGDIVDLLEENSWGVDSYSKLLEQIGGDGDGSSISYVYEVAVSDSDATLLIRVDGYYSSYDSNSWNDAYFCQPVPVVVIQYHRLNSEEA